MIDINKFSMRVIVFILVTIDKNCIVEFYCLLLISLYIKSLLVFLFSILIFAIVVLRLISKLSLLSSIA